MQLSSRSVRHQETTAQFKTTCNQWRIQGEGPGGGLDPSPIRPYACFRLKFLHRQDRIPLFNWLVSLMKRALDFATKQNSRDIQKCHWCWVPSYDLFASARKTVVNLSKDVFERRTSTGSVFFFIFEQ